MPTIYTNIHSHPQRTLLLWGFTLSTLLTPALAQTNARYSGTASCERKVDGVYYTNNMAGGGRYTYDETHTWTITGPPTLQQGYWRYPATWRVNGSGLKTHTLGSQSIVTTLSVDHTIPVEIQVFNRSSDNYRLINRWGSTGQQTVVLVSTTVTENGVPKRLPDWFGGVWEWQFPALPVPSSVTNVSGSSTTGWVVGPSLGIQQPGGLPVKTDCQWQFNSAPAACTYGLSPTSYQAPAAGGSSSTAVTTGDSSCAWTATSNDAFLSITSGSGGTGPGTVSFQVQPNPNPHPRTGTLTIAGQTFTVQQAAAAVPCTFTISPTSYQAPISGGSSSVAVTASNASCPWNATSNSSFLSITAGNSGTGSGTVLFQVQPNPSPQSRTGTLTIAGHIFTVQQAGGVLTCSYSINPTSYQATAAGGYSSFTVTPSDPSCPFAASSQSPFLSISAGTFGIGQQNVSFTVQPNTSTQPRTGTITVETETFTVNQAAAPPPGCTYTVSPPNFQIAAAGGPLSVSVSTNQPNCQWSSSTDATFVSIVSGASGTGTQNVSLSVQANPNSQPRNATLLIAGQLVSINQAAAAGCTFSLDTATLNFPASGASGSVRLTASAPDCAWTVTGAYSWIVLTSGLSGTGSATITFQVLANPGSAVRTALMTAGGQPLSINQAALSLQTGLRYVPMTPCRVMETRGPYNFEGRTGSFGPPSLLRAELRTLILPSSNVCSIPATAKAYVLNVTVIPNGGLDYVTIWAAGEPRPDAWTIRSPDSEVVANSAIVKAGTGGGISVYASQRTDLLLDITGYFVEQAGYVFYPLTPCRIIDTRSGYRSPGPFGPPSMLAGQTRRFHFPSNPHCTVPVAAAYSVTITVVPPAALGFLTAWPGGQARPNVSSINSFGGRVLANSVIVPAAIDGSIDVFVSDRADFLVDINGYYAADNGRGLFYYPVTQCRASDSAASGVTHPANTTRAINIPFAPACSGVSTNAQAYAINVTALPDGNPLPYITAWATGTMMPNASILNAFQGQVVTNAAVVPAGLNGAIDVYTSARTNVVLEVSGYFGR